MAAQTQSELVGQWRKVQDEYFRTSNAIDRELESRFDIGFSEFEILDLLAEDTRDECQMKELSQRTPLTQSALSRIVDRLEKAGLVQRSACAADRRSMFLQLTAKGVSLHESAAAVHRRVLEENLRA